MGRQAKEAPSSRRPATRPGRRAGRRDGKRTPAGPVGSSFPAMTSQERTRELLRLACDACTGIAAFAALTGGEVIVEAADGDTTPQVDEQILALAGVARARLSTTGGKSWSGQLPGASEAERLGCIAVPLARGERILGVVGVVDFLLLGVDGEIEAMLLQVAAQLGEAVASPSVETETALATPRVEEPEPRAFTLLGAMIEQLPEGVVVAREDGTLLYVNRTFATLAHRSPEDLLAGGLNAVLREEPGEDEAVVAQTEPTQAEPTQGEPTQAEPTQGGAGRLLAAGALGRRLALQLPGGRSIPVDVRGRRIEVGVVGECYAALVRDARQPLVGPVEAAGAALLEEILDSVDDVICVCDADERVVLANRAATRLLGTDVDDLTGRPFPFSAELRTPEGTPLRFEDHPVTRALHGTTVVAEHVVLEGPGDHRRHLLLSARPFGVAGAPGALVIAREITAQLDQEARLMQLALHDPLTGLANRYLLLDYLQRTFRQVRSRGGAMALLYLDLDDFKSINDTHGHDVGDEVLMAVAGRLQGATRASDLVARLSGDEFVIVATAASLEAESIEVLMGRLRQVLSAPYHIRDHLLHVGASIGWVIADPQLEDPMTLLVRADEAMYRQKQARGSRRGGEARW